MFYEILRPYELSLWTLQDSFITVLKPIGSFNRGQIETPKCRIKNDGTQELNFSIPMYYREEGILVENPIWFNVINGSLIVNLRKLKLIFNKGEEGEEIIEFVINNVTETHADGQLRCEVTAEGLAFQELGKVGYKISLASQDFIDEYNEWYSKTVGTGEGYDYSSEEAKELDKPINNINYWCEKIFANSYWDYEIQMDWSSFDGITSKMKNSAREAAGLRRTDKIYEEEYISSWEQEGSEEEGRLIPGNMESFREKLRLVDLEKSNFYNLTQNLAETFGVFCKYKYIYDANYHIIGKKCIFYNNFLSEQEGKIDITYPYSTSKIEREINSADIVTKMFVTPIEEESSPSGLVTIASVPANKSREDYILNFDYLYNIGTISQEQYNSIADYERTMYSVNTELEPLSAQIAKLQRDLTDYEAKLTLAKEGQILAKEKMKNASDMIAAIMGDSTRLYRNLNNPYKKLLTATGQSDLGQLYSFSFSLQGIVPNDHPDLKTLYGYPLHEGDAENVYGIKLWYKDEVTSSDYISYEDFLKKKFKKSDGSVDEEKVLKNNFKIDLDGDNNVVSLSNIFLADDSVDNFYYATFSYLPQLQYQNIYDTYAKKLATEEAAEKEAAEKIKESEDKLKKIKEKYNLLLQKKQVKTTEFENMMGPALKEGSWQADNYSDYGSKYSGSVGYQSSTTEHVSFIWDTLSFEEEQLLYETTTINEEQVFYPCIDLTHKLSTGKTDQNGNVIYETLLSKIKNNLDNLSFIYDITVTTDEG